MTRIKKGTKNGKRRGLIVQPRDLDLLRELAVMRVADPHRIARNHRTHSDGIWAHAGHREARRRPEARRGHPGHRDRADADPGCPYEPLVGNTLVAANRPGCDWDQCLAVATTTTANTEEQRRPGRNSTALIPIPVLFPHALKNRLRCRLQDSSSSNCFLPLHRCSRNCSGH